MNADEEGYCLSQINAFDFGKMKETDEAHQRSALYPHYLRGIRVACMVSLFSSSSHEYDMLFQTWYNGVDGVRCCRSGCESARTAYPVMKASTVVGTTSYLARILS